MENLLTKNIHGFFETASKPTQRELESYYAEKYYQQPSGQYQTEYSEDELVFFKNKAVVCEHIIKQLVPDVSSLFEVGCGEGFFANEFYIGGTEITLNDFSELGIETFNPQLKPFLKQCDVYEHIEDLAAEDKYFSLISMDNVLEHVMNPAELLEKIKLIMRDDSVLRITVPNDFSAFQQMLLNKELTTNTWVCPPEHLSYFNSKNLVIFSESLKFKILSVQCDFPIELFLTNPHSHYYNEKNLGKAAHHSRVLCTNYLIKTDIEAFINLSEAAAKLQFGRNVTIYLTL
jgi:2-polyprenyl-3-methyl-5-hydroxy-6-metoxy-1,4-benzoquinol methylase